MNNILELMNNYFVFLHEFMEVYTKYSYGDEKDSSELRKMSSLNNIKIDEIHDSINGLTIEEKESLRNKVCEIIIFLNDEKNKAYINLNSIDAKEMNSFSSGMQNIGDIIGDIEHKIYCYERIIISYLDENQYTKKMTS